MCGCEMVVGKEVCCVTVVSSTVLCLLAWMVAHSVHVIELCFHFSFHLSGNGSCG